MSHISFYILASGCTRKKGKKVIQQRQCDALGNVLLRNFGPWHSGGCYFDMTTHLNIGGYTPKHLASMEHRYFFIYYNYNKDIHSIRQVGLMLWLIGACPYSGFCGSAHSLKMRIKGFEQRPFCWTNN